MAFNTRKVILDLEAIYDIAENGVSVSFQPIKLLSATDGGLLIPAEKVIPYKPDGENFIILKTDSTGAVRYKCRVGFRAVFGEFFFDLTAGGDIYLSELYQVGTGDFPPPVYAYIDAKINQTGINEDLNLIYQTAKL